MNPVRPPIAPTVQPSQPMDPARVAAQRAFFEAALGRAAPVQAAAPAPEAPPAAPLRKVPDPGQAPPERILRPGSILDIRV